MATIFTKIITGEIPCYKVHENEHFIAFLDINPNAKGHTLCVPKKETNKLFDLNDSEYTALMNFSKQVVLANRNGSNWVRSSPRSRSLDSSSQYGKRNVSTQSFPETPRIRSVG